MEKSQKINKEFLTDLEKEILDTMLYIDRHYKAFIRTYGQLPSNTQVIYDSFPEIMEDIAKSSKRREDIKIKESKEIEQKKNNAHFFCSNCDRPSIGKILDEKHIVHKSIFSYVYRCNSCLIQIESTKTIKTVSCPKCKSKENIKKIGSNEKSGYTDDVYKILCKTCKKEVKADKVLNDEELRQMAEMMIKNIMKLKDSKEPMPKGFDKIEDVAKKLTKNLTEDEDSSKKLKLYEDEMRKIEEEKQESLKAMLKIFNAIKVQLMNHGRKPTEC